MSNLEKDFVHLVRLALDGRTSDVAALARRSLRQIIHDRPDLASEARTILSRTTDGEITRSAVSMPLPIDADSRLELLRREIQPQTIIEPVWPVKIADELDFVLQERMREEELAKKGLAPTRSMLFIGPPGVGKTLAARWLASKLGRPLLTLDLAAVMSSFLGRTGNNIRIVLDYARSTSSVLLLDEFDAIAKRRDDASDVGELKRLVTVLLQAVDEWPHHGVLIAATNHPELLDPAIWRRFDRVLEFPKPTVNEIRATIESVIGQDDIGAVSDTLHILAELMEDLSFADVVRLTLSARRRAIVRGKTLDQSLLDAACTLMGTAGRRKKLGLVAALERRGVSQRKISDITGVSRDTIRKHGKEK